MNILGRGRNICHVYRVLDSTIPVILPSILGYILLCCILSEGCAFRIALLVANHGNVFPTIYKLGPERKGKRDNTGFRSLGPLQGADWHQICI